MVYQIMHRINDNIKKLNKLKFNYSYKENEATSKIN